MRVFLSLILLGLAIAQASAQILFSFDYQDEAGSGFMADGQLGEQRRASIEQAGRLLSGYLYSSSPVTVVYSVSSGLGGKNGNLASAPSSLVSYEPGFWNTISQEKILTGNDINGDGFDGWIDFNFSYDFFLGDQVVSNQWDLIAVTMHEILHLLGFSSRLNGDGSGASRQTAGEPDAWSKFDRFLTSRQGVPLIDDNYAFNLAGLGPNPLSVLTKNPGIYFDGPNERKGLFNNFAPLYSPAVWKAGSSADHLDDTTFDDPSGFLRRQLMNAFSYPGRGPRELSDVELGILKDIGYTLVPEPGVVHLFLFSFFLYGMYRLRKRHAPRHR